MVLPTGSPPVLRLIPLLPIRYVITGMVKGSSPVTIRGAGAGVTTFLFPSSMTALFGNPGLRMARLAQLAKMTRLGRLRARLAPTAGESFVWQAIHLNLTKWPNWPRLPAPGHRHSAVGGLTAHLKSRSRISNISVKGHHRQNFWHRGCLVFFSSLCFHAGVSDGESESDFTSSYSFGPHFITLGKANNGTVTGDQSVTQLIASGHRGDTVIQVCEAYSYAAARSYMSLPRQAPRGPSQNRASDS